MIAALTRPSKCARTAVQPLGESLLARRARPFRVPLASSSGRRIIELRVEEPFGGERVAQADVLDGGAAGTAGG